MPRSGSHETAVEAFAEAADSVCEFQPVMPRFPKPEATLSGDQSPETDPRSSKRFSVERMASLGRLAAGVAHEINNPLAYVLGSIELLERGLAEIGSLHPEAARTGEIVFDAQAALTNAKDGVERIRSIVKDLTTFSRAVPESRRSVNVEAVLDSTLNLTWNQLRHRVRVVKSFSGVPDSLGDEGRLAQVFVNLILNAAQAIPDDRQGVLRISTTSEGGRVSVCIEDDGTIIAAEDLPYVFEPFFAMERRPWPPGDPCRPEQGGAGLGLAICRNIVTALGGTISVASEPAAGTRFTVTLQAVGTDVPAEGKRATSRERVMNRARILIIDDEPLLGQTLRFAFQEKHDVEVIASGREAVERLAQDADFDLVLCDLMMPDVSGEHVYRAVSEHSPGLLPRFVFMTGGAFTERAQEFLAQFAGRQLEKPFNIDEIELLLAELAAPGAA
jgi:two-component system, cell cycle sensor histidine kinase and response regulator CckA